MKFSLGEIADRFDLEIVGEASTEIRGIANLVDAVPGDLSFLFNPSYKKHLQTSRASAVVLRTTDVTDCDIKEWFTFKVTIFDLKDRSLFDIAFCDIKDSHSDLVN